MSAELKEALEWFDRHPIVMGFQSQTLSPPTAVLMTIVEAARRVTEADEQRVCVVHNCLVMGVDSPRCAIAGFIAKEIEPAPCDMVAGRLLLPAEEEK